MEDFEMSEENFNGNVNNDQQQYQQYQQPQQNYQQPYQQNYGQQGPDQSNVLPIVAMVLGIVSIVLTCFVSASWSTWLGLACAVAAIVIGAISKKKFGKNAMATAGLVCGIVAIALWVLAIILVLVAGFALVGALS